MISSLLKNRGLRLQLLVGLLLVIGTLPEPSEGLTCYNCIGAGKEPAKLIEACVEDKENANECRAGIKYCYSQKIVYKGRVTILKRCMANEEAECRKSKLGSNCEVGIGVEEAEELLKKVSTCKGSGREEEKADPDAALATECVCDSDRCNTGSSGGHSTSVIISAILTLVCYNNIY